MTERLWRSLRIEGSERPLASSLFLQSFLLGLPQLFTATAAAALFLDSFAAGKLSFVIMAGGIIVPALGFLFSAALARIGAARALRAALILLPAGLGIIAAALAIFRGAPAVRLALILWVDVEYAFTELSYSAHANRVLDIRQAKRLFGFIGAGQVLAAMLGGAIAPWLLSFMPIEGLLGLSLAGLVGAWANFERMNRRYPLSSDDGEVSGDGSATAVLRDPLARLIFLLVAVEFCVQAFSETLFYDGLQRSTPSSSDVASYLAIFFGAAGACKLLLDLFASRPFLTRFGVRGGLVTPAIAMALPLAIHVLFAFSGAQAKAAFLPLAIARFIQTIALSSLYAPAYFTLYQPLRPALRSATQALADTAVGQIGAGIAGFVLFLLIGAPELGFRAVGIAAMLFIGLWILVALIVERRYRAEVAVRARGAHGKSGETADLAQEWDTDGGEVLQVLEAIAEEARPAERAKMLEGLFRSGKRVSSAAAKAASGPYRSALETEANFCVGYRDKAKALESGPLGLALEREAEKATERAILLLGLAYPRDAIGALRQGLLFAESGGRSYALELAESTLAGPDKKLLLPLFENADRVEGSSEGLAREPSRPGSAGLESARAGFLRSLADESERAAQDWLNTLALLELSRSPGGPEALRGAEAELLERETPIVERALYLAGAPIFSSVPSEDLAALGRSLRERSAPAGTKIISRGDAGSELYLVVSGRVNVSIEGLVLATMGAKEVFGELSALSPEPRSADVFAAEDSRLLVVGGAELRAFTAERWRTAFEILKVLDRRVMDTLRLKFPAENQATAAAHSRKKPKSEGRKLGEGEATEALNGIPLARRLPEEALEILRTRARIRGFETGQRIFSREDEAADFFIVLSGRVALELECRPVLEIGQGELFGDTEIVLAENRPYDAIALESCELLCLPRRALSDLVWDGTAFLRELTLLSADRLRRVTKLKDAKKVDRCSA